MSNVQRFLPFFILLLASLACQAAGSIWDGSQAKDGPASDNAATQVAGYIYAGVTMTAQAGAPPTQTPSQSPPVPQILPAPTQKQAQLSPLPPALITPTEALVAKLPTPTEQPPAAITASACKYSAYLDAENVPSGKEIPLNHKFTKSWKIRNTGTCDWTPDFSFVCMTNCDNFKAPNAVMLANRNIPPKGTIEIHIDLQAPKGDTFVRKLTTATFFIRGAGKIIGMQPDGKTPFTVTIKPVD
jgi:hypothetical protein